MSEIPKKVICDTNVLLDNFNVEDFEHVVVPVICVEELDKLKRSQDGDLAQRARKANRMLENADNVEVLFFSDFALPRYLDPNVNDNKIIGFVKDVCTANRDYVFLSNDLNVRLKAKNLGIECRSWVSKKVNEFYSHNGWLELDSVKDGESLAEWYSNDKKDNLWNLNINEYLVVKDADKIVEKLRWTEKGFKKINYKDIASRTMQKIKPVNLEQELLFDMLQDDKITIKCCTGTWGTGKDFCMLAHAFNMLESEKVKKIVWVRNTIEVKNSRPVGFLKGSLDDKLAPYAQIMCDHIGGKIGLEIMIQSGKIELQHLGFIRGRNIEDSIIYCSEAENMTKEHVQLLMGRVGSGSFLFLNGDMKQTDEAVFENNNGLGKMIETLKGHQKFAHVKLLKTERSETAAMADLLD